MLKESAAIIEFYRREAEERQEPTAEAEAPARAIAVALRAPDGVSAVHGYSGALYMVGADRVVVVKPEDSTALIAHGYERVTDEGAEN